MLIITMPPSGEFLSQHSNRWVEDLIGFLHAAGWLERENLYIYGHLYPGRSPNIDYKHVSYLFMGREIGGLQKIARGEDTFSCSTLDVTRPLHQFLPELTGIF